MVIGAKSEASDLDLVRDLFDLTGARWTIPVLAALKQGRRRFGELRRRLDGISAKQLAATLRELERDGFVIRYAFAIIPPRVEYELAQLGEELVDSAAPLGAFAVGHRNDIQAARRAYEAQPPGGPKFHSAAREERGRQMS